MKTYKINDITLSETELRKLIKENPELKEEEEVDRWFPKDGQEYFYLSDYGVINNVSLGGDCGDGFRWRTGNCFKTEKEAKKALERIEAINTVTLAIEEANEGWVPDWSNNCLKHIIIYNHMEEIVTGFTVKLQAPLILPHIKSEKIAEQIIRDYEEELKIIFEI